MIPLIRSIVADIRLLYTHFIHWNISKIVYYFYGILLGILFAIPFFVLFSLWTFASQFSFGMIADFLLYGENSLEFIGAFFADPAWSIFTVIALIWIAFALYVGISYGEYLLYRLNIWYIKKQLPKYFDTSKYLNKTFIWKYFTIWAWLGLFILIPFIVYGIACVILVVAFGWVQDLNAYLITYPESIITTLLFVWFIFTFLVSFYIGFRLGFSLIILADEKTHNKVSISYIKKSQALTRWWQKLSRFLGIILISIVLFFPIFWLEDYIDTSREDLSTYRDFIYIIDELGQENFESELLEKNISAYDTYKVLQLEYGNISIDDIIQQLRILQIFHILYTVLYIFVIYGIIQMIFSSFYIRELKHPTSQLKK